MNSKPIFGTETFVCANHFLKPFTIKNSEESFLETFQLRLDHLRDSVAGAHSQFASTLKATFLYDKWNILKRNDQYDFKDNDVCLLFRADRYTLVRILKFGKYYSQISIPGTIPQEKCNVHNSKMLLISRNNSE